MTVGYGLSQFGLPCIELDENCCFRNEFLNCGILINTEFPDERCHFRKERITGANKYDEEKKTHTNIHN